MVIISLKKQRKIKTSNLSLTGAIYSLKQNKPIEFESSLERDFISILEYNNDVFTYLEQPLKIGYYENNIKRVYVPDFWVEHRNGKKEVIEIKYSNEIINPNPQLKEKMHQANLFCKANNLDYKIMTEKEIRTPYLENAKFLLYYRTKGKFVNSNCVNLIFSKLKKLNRSSAEEIINSISHDKMTKAENLFSLWYLLAIDIIEYEEEKPLSMSSPIWLKNKN